MGGVAIGFRAKTGKAIAIALSGRTDQPQFCARWTVSLHDPSFPATGQPHHEVMELPWSEAQSAVRPLETRIERIATDMLTFSHAGLHPVRASGPFGSTPTETVGLFHLS